MHPSVIKEVQQKLIHHFKLECTTQQIEAFHALAEFFVGIHSQSTFVLQGAAGTGKTTMVNALVGTLDELECNVALLAPTGRAAKVIAEKTNRAASTIHKYIYAAETTLDGRMQFELLPNEDPAPTVYIVDEASMLNDESNEGVGRSVLYDLIHFVFGEHNEHKLILVGDPAQLPPVGQSISPALSAEYLRYRYALSVQEFAITQVKRQSLTSGILLNATRIREELSALTGKFPPLVYADDVQIIEDANDIIDIYLDNFNSDSLENVVLICYSNNMAVRLNNAIRARLYDSEDAKYIQKGDVVMVVKNHYQQRFHAMPFIANGEIAVIEQVFLDTLEKKHDAEWVDAQVAFIDTGQIMDTKIHLGLLNRKEPALPPQEATQIWHNRRLELQEENSKVSRADLQKDPYINCLQLKYGYAITTHKAQGGQWANVLVVFEPYLFKDANQNIEIYKSFLRWCYTAFTRATDKLYLFRAPFEFEALDN